MSSYLQIPNQDIETVIKNLAPGRVFVRENHQVRTGDYKRKLLLVVCKNAKEDILICTLTTSKIGQFQRINRGEVVVVNNSDVFKKPTEIQCHAIEN
jgi:hypothetical protein